MKGENLKILPLRRQDQEDGIVKRERSPLQDKS